jgi:hypothetical protein
MEPATMLNQLLSLVGVGRVKIVDDTGVVQRVQVDEGPLGPSGGRRLIDRVLKAGC